MNTGDTKRLEELFQLWTNHALPKADESAFFELLQQQDQQQALSGLMLQAWLEMAPTPTFSVDQKDKMLKGFGLRRTASPLPFYYLAAASVLVLAVAAFLFLRQQQQSEKQVTVPAVSQAAPKDIPAPTSNKAVLTLGDGSQITLDSLQNGALSTDGNIKVRKINDGQLVYSGESTSNVYHTLTVPRGSKPVQLTLADGSSVYLNVASSITYPGSFSGSSRKVTMTGEAYFEVAAVTEDKLPKNHIPFIVDANGVQVEVMGTHFNVNAYSDESELKTTLLEGSVNIVAGDHRQLLAPGQQAVVANRQHASGAIKLIRNADVEEAMAWINGKFKFSNADVEEVMRQVSRWYDVEVRFAAKPNMRFGGQIDRNSTLRQMFTILERSGLHISLEANQVTVLP